MKHCFNTNQLNLLRNFCYQFRKQFFPKRDARFLPTETGGGDKISMLAAKFSHSDAFDGRKKSQTFFPLAFAWSAIFGASSSTTKKPALEVLILGESFASYFSNRNEYIKLLSVKITRKKILTFRQFEIN